MSVITSSDALVSVKRTLSGEKNRDERIPSQGCESNFFVCGLWIRFITLSHDERIRLKQYWWKEKKQGSHGTHPINYYHFLYLFMLAAARALCIRRVLGKQICLGRRRWKEEDFDSAGDGKRKLVRFPVPWIHKGEIVSELTASA